MIIGIGLMVFGYAIGYWGLHHFPGVDCPGNNPLNCRYSLIDVLGIPTAWGITKGQPVQIFPGLQAPNMQPFQPGQPGANLQPTPTQPQTPSNTTTPNSITT